MQSYAKSRFVSLFYYILISTAFRLPFTQKFGYNQTRKGDRSDNSSASDYISLT